MNRRALSPFASFPLLAPDGEGGGGAGGEGTQNGNDDANPGGNGGDQGAEPKVEFTAEQQKRIDKLIGDARREGKETEKRRREQADADADAERKRKADEERGDFEKVKAALEGERDQAKADAETLAEKVAKLEAAMKTGVEGRWKELPERLRKLGEKLHGEDDALGRWAFLNDPDTAALVKELTDKEPPARGNGHDPRPGGHGAPSLQDEIRSLAARGGYSM